MVRGSSAGTRAEVKPTEVPARELPKGSVSKAGSNAEPLRRPETPPRPDQSIAQQESILRLREQKRLQELKDAANEEETRVQALKQEAEQEDQKRVGAQVLAEQEARQRAEAEASAERVGREKAEAAARAERDTKEKLEQDARKKAEMEDERIRNYSGPRFGTIVWEGEVQGTELITIENGQASSGTVEGDPLPGVPVLVQPTESKRVGIASSPGPRNNYKSIVFRVLGHGRQRVTLRWSLP
jgi:type IV secretory pathway VirB10-like protein